MHFWKRFLVSVLTLPCLLGVQTVWMSPAAKAAVDVTATELQNLATLLKPDVSSLGTLDGFSSFYYRKQSPVAGGILTRYQVLLLNNPWLDKGLPELQILTLAYANQEAADSAFETLKESARFNTEDLFLSSETSHAFFYLHPEATAHVDLMNSIGTNFKSFHWLEKNGNTLIQSSLYLGDGTVHEDTLKTFLALNPTSISEFLSEATDAGKISLGLLFPPRNPFFTAKTESSFVKLDESLTLPSNGSLSLNIYVSDPGAAMGTVLDSSGVLSASEGDLYLYINKEGKLLAGLYAPYYDADCKQVAGWYQLTSSQTLYPYEWNHVVLRFGVGGFGLTLNDASETHCSVSQARSARPLYLGDYELDTVSEGMIGAVDEVKSAFSLDSLGRQIDKVLGDQLFLDLEASDADFEIFKELKARHVFLGTDGVLNPEGALNRASMVKIILRAFALGSSTGDVSFTDLASDAWYRKYVAKAVEIGMVQGREDGSFGGGDLVTRAEFFTMLERLDSEFDPSKVENVYLDVNSAAWFSKGAAYAQAKGFVEGTLFYPTQRVSRRMAAQVLYQLMP